LDEIWTWIYCKEKNLTQEIALKNPDAGDIWLWVDGHRPYLEAIEEAFGAEVDYGQLQKIYGAPSDERSAALLSSALHWLRHENCERDPEPKHISTSYVERQNWTLRNNSRRYTRLSNGFSRKLENHAAAVALTYFAYNFIKIHRTLRTSPAMAAGVTDRLWDGMILWPCGKPTNSGGQKERRKM
jgi:hypothetical protein